LKQKLKNEAVISKLDIFYISEKYTHIYAYIYLIERKYILIKKYKVKIIPH